MNRFIFAALPAAFIFSAPQLAFAHATLETATAKSGGPWKGSARIGHGCEGTATTTLRVTMPEGMIGVHPMPKAGWKLEVVNGPDAKAYELNAKPVSEEPKALVWSGAPLPDASYDGFAFGGSIAKGVTGALPAPVLTVTDDTPAPAYSLGALSVSAPWTRATPKGADVAGGYMSITNSGKEADRLLGGSASIAGRFELHEMATVDGVMKMREFAAGIEIRPGETLVFKPGGLHIMLMGLKKQVKEGDRIEAVLKFEKAGTLDIAFTAAAIGAGAPAAGQGHDHAH